jgi:hypothetical protein
MEPGLIEDFQEVLAGHQHSTMQVEEEVQVEEDSLDLLSAVVEAEDQDFLATLPVQLNVMPLVDPPPILVSQEVLVEPTPVVAVEQGLVVQHCWPVPVVLV